MSFYRYPRKPMPGPAAAAAPPATQRNAPVAATRMLLACLAATAISMANPRGALCDVPPEPPSTNRPPPPLPPQKKPVKPTPAPTKPEPNPFPGNGRTAD